MAGMLSAIPKTPLYDRLEAAGRLDNAAADDAHVATNIIPLGTSYDRCISHTRFLSLRTPP
jgi:hypothetical protein